MTVRINSPAPLCLFMSLVWAESAVKSFKLYSQLKDETSEQRRRKKAVQNRANWEILKKSNLKNIKNDDCVNFLYGNHHQKWKNSHRQDSIRKESALIKRWFWKKRSLNLDRMSCTWIFFSMLCNLVYISRKQWWSKQLEPPSFC